jgi:hypothetical protein
MRTFISGLPGTFIMLACIIAALVLILMEATNDELIFLGIPAVILLILAAVIRLLKDIFKTQQGQRSN